MRVAFIINDLSGGGAEKALLLLSSYLRRQGVEVRLFTLQGGNDSYEAPSEYSRTVLTTGTLCNGAGRFLALPLQGAELAHRLKHFRQDISVSFLPRANIAHALTRGFGNRRPIVVTEQAQTDMQYPSEKVGDQVMRAAIRRAYPRADLVLPCSHGVQKGLQAFGVDAARMQVVNNPIDTDAIVRSARAEAPLENSEVPTIMTVGRHFAQKDHSTLIRAFARLRRSAAARLVFVGQGPQRAQLERLCNELGVAGDVVFAGFQSNPFSWLARADLFVLSSVYEGFGNVLVEAMACGVPVVSTNCPSGPSEILADGEHGLLVPVGDVEALSRAMLEILFDKRLRAELGTKSRKRARDFDISVVGARYHRLLSDVVAAHRSQEVVGRSASHHARDEADTSGGAVR